MLPAGKGGKDSVDTEEVPPSDDGERSTDARSASVPYMSFQGFRNLLDRLANDGLPQVFDRSFFGDVSGSLVAQTRGGLRFFDLIDDDRRPTDLLRTLAKADEQGRIAILHDLASDKYSAVIALGSDATHGQLVDVFRATGLNGASVTKAITFYLGLAEYAELPVSPFFKKTTSRPSGGNGGGARRSTARRRRTASQPELPPAPSPRESVGSLDEKKGAYIDLLMRLAEQSTEKSDVQADLLNRLERALGYEAPP